MLGSEKKPVSHLQKVENTNLSVVNTYNLSINFLASQRLYFSCLESLKQELLSNQQHGTPC